MDNEGKNIKKRAVKCCVTGEKGYNTTFYKVDKRYYKSKEVYEEKQRELYYKKECRKLLLQLFNYRATDVSKESQIEINKVHREGEKPSPKLLFLELKRLGEKTTWDVVLHAITMSKHKITYSLENKFFPNEFSKIRYIFAIIENNIEPAIRDLAWINKAKQLKKQRENKLVEKRIEENINMGTEEVERKCTDISKFL